MQNIIAMEALCFSPLLLPSSFPSRYSSLCPKPKPTHHGFLICRAEQGEGGEGGGGRETVSIRNPTSNLPDPDGEKLEKEAATSSNKPNRETRGFGSSTSSTSTGFGKENKRAPKDRRKSDVRRIAANKPVVAPPVDSQSQQLETVFVTSWAFLGVLILSEGIVLAASGFLPEEWDDYIVKVLYPSFTPTVLLFLGGAASYGLYKYLSAAKN